MKQSEEERTRKSSAPTAEPRRRPSDTASHRIAPAAPAEGAVSTVATREHLAAAREQHGVLVATRDLDDEPEARPHARHGPRRGVGQLRWGVAELAVPDNTNQDVEKASYNSACHGCNREARGSRPATHSLFPNVNTACVDSSTCSTTPQQAAVVSVGDNTKGGSTSEDAG